jgi:TetR/AcrR family transcriptional regulator
MSPKNLIPTETRILDAAEAAFAAQGYAASLAEIASAVGIRPPSLYKHFGSKRALYEAVLERLLGPYFNTLDGALKPPTSAEEGVRNLEIVIEQYWRRPNLARVVQHAALVGGEDLQMVVERYYRPLFARAATYSHVPATQGKGKAPADALRLVLAFHAMISGYVTLAPLHEALLGVDPLAPGPLREQARMMQALVSSTWDA